MAEPLIKTALALAIVASAATAGAQAAPTAVRQIDFTAFGLVTGAFTGLASPPGGHQGRNLDITAGFDANLPSIYGVRPSLEIRGSYPIHDSNTDTQRELLGGVRAEYALHRLHPYGDFLIGGGHIDYGREDFGFITPSGLAITGYTTSTVLSPGVGVRYDLAHGFGAMADLQLQHWNSPVTESGHFFAKYLSAGVSYTFALGHNYTH